MRILIIFFLCFTMYSVNAQTDLQHEILGKWEFVKVTTDSEKNTSKQVENHFSKELKDPFMRKDVLPTFLNDNAITFEVGDFLMHAKYAIKDSVLTIGAHRYQILKITKQTLHLQAQNDSMLASYEYQRIEIKKR